MTSAPSVIPSRQPAGNTLADCIERGDHYTVIRSALAHLEKDPLHEPALLLAARSLIAIGLVGPARELLAEVQEQSEHSDQAREVSRCIDGLPSGRVAWGQLQPRFDANWRQLLDAKPELAAHEETFRSLPRTLELYRATDGNVHVSRRLDRGRRVWLPDLSDAKQAVAKAQMGHADGALMCSPYLVLGDRQFGLLNRVYESTNGMYLSFAPRVYFVQPDVELFGAALYVAESIEPLCDERVSAFVGPDAVDGLIRHLEANPSRALPEHTLIDPSYAATGVDELREKLTPLAEDRAKRVEAYRAETASRCSQLPADHWAELFNSGKPLRILGLTSRFTTVLQYAMRDFGHAFERLGHTFHMLIERNDNDLLNPRLLVESIASFKPDLIVQIDHLCAEMADLLPKGIPSVCWIQDRMPRLFTKEAGQNVRPLEFVLGYGFPECITQFDYPADRFLPCPIPASPKMLPDPSECEANLASYRCDVMYASNFRREPDGLFAEHRLRFIASDQPVFDAAYENLRRVINQPWFCGDYDYASLVREAEEQSGSQASNTAVRDDIVATLAFLADAHIRQNMVRSVARWADATGGSFHLYGEGWSEHPDFARFARGRVEHGAALGQAFRGAKISLHGGRNPALHQRVLDGLAAGGFFLIGAKPSDAAHPANQAILRFIKEHEGDLPKRLKPSDLPEPHATFYTDFLRVRGNDPDAGVELTREMALNVIAECEWKTRHSASSLWPDYERITFRTDDELFCRIDHFLHNDDERNLIKTKMRNAVLENFTYEALARQLLNFMATRLHPTRQ